MEYFIAELIEHLKLLEQLLKKDFSLLAEALRKKPAAAAGEKQFRLAEQLQYHDIIRQKIEHVRHFMEEQNSELLQEKREADTQLSIELIELSLAILRYTQAEYQEVQQKTQHLISPSEEDQQPALNGLFEPELLGLIKKLETLYLQMDDEEDQAAEGGKRSERFRRIWESFSMESEREVFAMLFEEQESEKTDSEEENESPEGQVELF